jgi:uncharacterized protein involved in outer membrane biogenesis
MRKIVIALVILVILSGVVALALMNLSGLIDRNKDYLLAQAEQTLGRKVTVEKIGVTLWGGIGVRLSNFALVDDPAFSQENFLQAADLQVNVEFLPLFWKELRVTRLILHQPAITIIRDKQGRFNFASLGAAAKEQSPALEQKDTAEHSSSSTATPFPLVASLMDLSAGTVRYIDRQDQTDFQVSQVDLTIEDLSFDQPFVLNLTTAVLAERQNFSMQSRIGPLGPTLDFKNLPIEGTLKIDSLDLNALQQASQVRDVNLTELFRSTLTTAPQHIEGQANLDLTLSGRGQGWEELKPSLQGQGRAEVSQGALLNVNIAEGVLSGVTGLPGLSLLVSPRVRDRYPEVFATQNTTFDELHSTFTFNNGKMNIDDLRISAADYTMQGKGWVDFDQQLDLRAQLILSQKLSTDIADDVKEAKYIVNEQNRVEIPFALAGTLPKVRPQPDLAYVGRLLQRAALRRGAEELEKRVLRKILPSPRQSSPTEGESSTAAPPTSEQPPQEDPKEQLLRKGLDKLFGR